MSAMFTEYQNANSLRKHPFAPFASMVDQAGVEMPVNTFVDACIHVPGASSAYVSRISAGDRLVEVVSTGSRTVVLTGKVGSSRQVDLYSPVSPGTPRRLLLGTMVLGRDPDDVLSSVGEARYAPGATAFSSACVIPIASSGVTSTTIAGDYASAVRRDDYVEFEEGSGLGTIEAVLSEEESGEQSIPTMRFDAKPLLPGVDGDGVRIVVFECNSKYFTVNHLSDNVVWVGLSDISREDICAMVHAHDSATSLAVNDYCENPSPPDTPITPRKPMTDMFALDMSQLHSKNIVISVEDGINYANPLYVRMANGTASVSPAEIGNASTVPDIEAKVVSGKALPKTSMTGNAVEIGIMGMQ